MWRLVADFDELDEWRDFIQHGDEHGEIQLFCALGITPNTDTERLIARLAYQSTVGDHLLISANLYRPDDSKHGLRAILPQYDNPESRRWLTSFFTDLDWPVTPEQLVFEIREQESPTRLSATLTLSQTQVVSIDTAAFEIPVGTRFGCVLQQSVPSGRLGRPARPARVRP